MTDTDSLSADLSAETSETSVIAISIRSLAGDELFALQVPENETVRHVKVRCGAGIFSHQLLHDTQGILHNDASLASLAKTKLGGVPVLRLQVLRRAFVRHLGPLLFDPVSIGDSSAVERILARLANPDCARYQDDQTPLSIASKKGNVEMVQILIEAGAEKDKPRNLLGATAIRMAAREGHLSVVRFLCEAGANYEKPTIDGTTPLYIAAEKGHLRLVRFLCGMKADKNKANNYGATPLSIATFQDNLQVSKFLREAGA
eukprot:gnl/TRDRNA2_/TRDRNA2_174800_c2_seq1.p1 gnl/TRDRNA2_/TRDRNA2_174800_c2~~gnl/TRDRNA2_/TRDRNA2_174800_c2_seq1.p1  ORF type:complete len:260 (-),score=39.55 gnl/TRDRNA2_/TRDRNA2_174800_c2_seq1:370-1149(-)